MEQEPSAQQENHQEHKPDHHAAPSGRHLLALALGALGVVYGDIGTSPLYAFRESFHHTHGLAVSHDNVLGVLSLIFWALVIIISIKYITFVMRADNQGEGGILALTSLIVPLRGIDRRAPRYRLILLGLFGTALLYGDGAITPAISVLSAVEGLEVATPFFAPYILPITIVILVLLFLFQRHGTERVGQIFGPITLVWFALLALLGISWVVRRPEVLLAVNPWYGVEFFVRNGWPGYLVLGSVFLVVTGGEALYADMGHFGKLPIRVAWFTVVFPALLLNYFGQGALLLTDPAAIENPFYHMAPVWALYPVVICATAATVIASQALITGAFSLTMQAVRLGYLPRVAIEHTSAKERGQIYIASVNWLLMFGCIALVLAFGSSSNLAAAYGVAVTTTMVITAVLLYVVQLERWRWPFLGATAFFVLIMIVDLAFWGANLVKIPSGGWLPLVIGLVGFTMMTTWRRGRTILAERLSENDLSFAEFVRHVHEQRFTRVPGTAVFMYSKPDYTPRALVNNLEHNKVIHEQVILLSVITKEVPRVRGAHRIEVTNLKDGFWRILLYYGFMDDPNVPRDLVLARNHGLKLKLADVTYFLGRERLLATKRPGMALWRESLFAVMTRNSRPATDFFHLPPDRVVEITIQVEM